MPSNLEFVEYVQEQIENLDDREFLAEFIRRTCEELPIPKQKPAFR